MEEHTEIRGFRTFIIVWLGQLASILGSGITSFALSVWVYQRTGSVTDFSLVALSAVLPGLLLSPVAGALVDRWDRRWTMIFSDTADGLILLAIALLLGAGQLDVWHICVANGIGSILGAFQGPAYIAATTLMIPKEHLGRASGMREMVQAGTQILAPMLGGVLLAIIGLQGIILLDFATLLIAIITLLSVRFPQIKPSNAGESAKPSLLREIAYGWSYITARPGLLALFVFFAIIGFFGAIFSVLITPLVLSFSSEVILGTLLSIGGVGMLLGSLVMSIWGGPERRMPIVFGFMLLDGLWMSVAGLSTSTIVLGVLAFVSFFAEPIVGGSIQVMLQKKVAVNVQGRVFTLAALISDSSLPFAYLIAGPLADYVFEPLMAVDGPLASSVGQVIGVGPGRGIGLMLVITGVLSMIVVVIAYSYPRLRLMEDEVPDAIPDSTNSYKAIETNDPIFTPTVNKNIDFIPLMEGGEMPNCKKNE